MSRYLALDFDSSGLYACIGTVQRGSLKLERALHLPENFAAITPERLGELGLKLRAFVKDAGVEAMPTLVSVPRDRLIFKDVKHPKCQPTEEPALVKFQAQRDLAVPPESLVMDYVPVPAAGDERGAVAVFVRKDSLEAIRTLCDGAGLKLQLVHPRPYATAVAVQHALKHGQLHLPDHTGQAVATLSIWPGGGEFLVQREAQVLFSRSLSQNGTVSEAAFLGEAKRSLAAYRMANPKVELNQLILCENGDAGPTWTARLQQALGLPVQPFDPVAALKPSKNAPEASAPYLAPLGLLATRALPTATPLNFLTPRQPKNETSTSTKWLAIAGFAYLMLALVGMLGLYLLNDQLDGRRIAAALAKDKLGKDFITAQFDVNRRMSVTDFRGHGVNWLDVFYDLTEATSSVDKMRLKEFDAKIVDLPQPVNVIVDLKKNIAQRSLTRGLLQLKLITADDQAFSDFYSTFVNERQNYANPNNKEESVAGRNAGDAKDVTINVDVLPRKPSDFTRVLKAEFPKLPVAPPEPLKADAAADAEEQP